MRKEKIIMLVRPDLGTVSFSDGKNRHILTIDKLIVIFFEKLF